jgi:hypothetical protein
LQLQFEYVSSATVARLPAAANLFQERALERLAPGSVAVHKITSRLRQLERVLFDGERPALDSQPCASAIAALAQSENHRLMASVTRAS